MKKTKYFTIITMLCILVGMITGCNKLPVEQGEVQLIRQNDKEVTVKALFSENDLEDFLDLDLNSDDKDIKEALEYLFKSISIDDIEVELNKDSAYITFIIENVEETDLRIDEEEEDIDDIEDFIEDALGDSDSNTSIDIEDIEDFIEEVLVDSDSNKSTDISSSKMIADATATVRAIFDEYSGVTGVFNLNAGIGSVDAGFIEAIANKLGTVPKPKFKGIDIEMSDFLVSIENDGSIKVFACPEGSLNIDEALMLFPTPSEEYNY